MRAATRLTAWALGTALCVLMVVTVLALSGHMGPWLPFAAATDARAVDSQLHWNLMVLGAVFLVFQGAIAFMLLRPRGETSGSEVAGAEKAESGRSEWVALAAALALFGGIGIGGAKLPVAKPAADENDGTGPSAAKAITEGDEPQTLHVEVTGAQFRWYFRYPGADGKLGRTEPKMIDASAGNPLGIVRADEAAKDDIVSSELVVPEGRAVELALRSQDVVHSFFAPAFRAKQDAVPGMATSLSLTPTQRGDYEIVCSQLCGLGHFGMNAKLRVVSAQEFNDWLRVHEAATDAGRASHDEQSQSSGAGR